MQSQNSQDKALTTLVRSMKRALKVSHGIDVPHAALRAVYLQAQGENPHAFAGKSVRSGPDDELKALVAEAPRYFHPGYDFDGEKLAWLQRAGLVPVDSPRVQMLSTPNVRTFYVVDDLDGPKNRALAFDPDGDVRVPAGFEGWGKDCQVLNMTAQLPKVSRYGLPDFYEDAQSFFAEYGLKLSTEYRGSYTDLGDDSGDSAEVQVYVCEQGWRKLMLAVLADDDSLRDKVAEWVGLHYSRHFDRERDARKAEWLERYLEAGVEGHDDDARLHSVKLEWVWPDEDSDYVEATVDLATGRVTPQAPVPEGVASSEVRCRVWSHPTEWTRFYEVYWAHGADAGFFVQANLLRQLRAEMGYTAHN